MENILQFQGTTRWLSNFALCNIELDGIIYPSTENAYMAAKTLDAEERKFFETCTPAQAKKQGRSVTLREGWDDVKDEYMYAFNWQKYTQEPYKSQLLATGDCQLVEGNVWGDTYWGVCNGVGQNKLGKIIMEIREVLRKNKKQMNLIIAGGRDFDDYYLLDKSLTWFLQNVDKPTITVFNGKAKGADCLGERWAKSQQIDVKLFPADWDTHGKKAGILRNQEMIDAGATHLVAFWDQKSKGTADMIKRATTAGLAVRVVKYEPKEGK